ncbi:GSCOCG00008257001-RA-CDS [Cotesia congregata]|nr:GSCOCG00008257001-RA-CDS [Cotesia congregata]
MAKLKPTVLQTEVTTEQEWKELLTSPGLTLVDVFSSWSGPCVAMVSILKKIKVEIGGDLLNFAVAQNDQIEALARFRDRSEPVWMFLQNGKFVNLTFGSDSQNLKRILQQELKRVAENEPPNWELLPLEPSPAEAKLGSDWRNQLEQQKSAQEQEEKRKKHEEYMEQMTAELSEETALVILPRIFMDDQGLQKDKEQSPPYLELMYRVLPDRFDVLEQTRVQLTEGMLQKMFVDSGQSLTEGLTKRFLEGESVAMRLKARAPPPDWPVPYPFISKDKRCARAIDDAENFLKFVVQEAATSKADDKRVNFVERYSYTEQDDEEEVQYPPVWFPPNARCKVHVFKTIFGAYMEKAHVYKPIRHPKRVVFKFEACKLQTVEDYCRNFAEAIDHFGVFEDDEDGEGQVVVVMRKISDEAFLAFAGSYPVFMEDNVVEVARIVEEYFPEVEEDSGEEEEEEDYGEEEDFEVSS